MRHAQADTLKQFNEIIDRLGALDGLQHFPKRIRVDLEFISRMLKIVRDDMYAHAEEVAR